MRFYKINEIPEDLLNEKRGEGVGVIHTAPTCPYCGTHQHLWDDWWPADGAGDRVGTRVMIVCEGKTKQGMCDAAYTCHFVAKKPLTFRSVKRKPRYRGDDLEEHDRDEER